MATILNAGTTTATGLNITTDTSGAMAIQTSGVNAISISSAQVVSLANPLAVTSGGTGNTTGASNAIANTGGWAVTPSGTKLYFSYNGTNVASMDSSGNLIVRGNVTTNSTIATANPTP
jgi:hypothetical protein